MAAFKLIEKIESIVDDDLDNFLIEKGIDEKDLIDARLELIHALIDSCTN